MRFNNLQILRLVAAMGVALSHLGIAAEMVFGVSDGSTEWLRMPRLSPLWVQTFFALSGFVLTHALQSCPPGRYLYLRAARLYPAYWIVTGTVIALIWSGWWPGRYPIEPNPSFAGLFLLPVRSGQPGGSILFVEWTLVYEVFLSVSLLGLWWVAGRKRLPLMVCVWLLVLGVKSLYRPGYGSEMVASWKSIFL